MIQKNNESQQLLLNIGNTTTSAALRCGNAIKHLAAFPTSNWEKGCIPDPVTSLNVPVVAASVVPPLKPILQSRFPHIVFLHEATTWDKLPVRFAPDVQRRIGADRVANLLAAHQLYPQPTIVVDCGTAITIETLDQNATFAGGVIMPGRELLRHALHSGTGQLPCPPLSPELLPPWQEQTEKAIQAGCDQMAVGALIRGLQLWRQREGFADAYVILTGGDAQFFHPPLHHCLPFPLIMAPRDFTMRGIALWAHTITQE